MHLGALAVFDPAPGASAPQLLDLLGARAAAIPRLRMRVRDVLLPVGGAACRPGRCTSSTARRMARSPYS